MKFRDRVRLSFLPLLILPLVFVLLMVTFWTRNSIYETEAILMESLIRQFADGAKLRMSLLDRAGLTADPFFREQTLRLVYEDADRIGGNRGLFIVVDLQTGTILHPEAPPATAKSLAECPVDVPRGFAWLRTESGAVFGAACRTDEDLNWEIWYLEPQATVLAPIIRLFWLSAITGLVTVLVGSAVAGYIATRIGAPLAELKTMAEAIGMGDLSFRNTIERDDEFGLLANSFNAMADRIGDLTENLESRIEERTQELESTVEHLEQAQDQLIESEKMAYLGKLVADLSHEINTPVGTSITAVTHLQSQLAILREAFEKGELTKSRFSSFIDQSEELCASMFASLERATELIGAFKKLSVDHMTEREGDIRVKEYLEGIILSMKPILKEGGHEIRLDVSEDLTIHGTPSAFAQVFTNLITNSVIHGFENRRGGVIQIRGFAVGQDCWFEFEDNGVGMDAAIAEQIFLPFFTTKRNRGGTGLGLHIVYNHVHQTFGGQIRVTSTPGAGTLFHVRIPLVPEGVASKES